jgi:hypothetical protein
MGVCCATIDAIDNLPERAHEHYAMSIIINESKEERHTADWNTGMRALPLDPRSHLHA